MSKAGIVTQETELKQIDLVVIAHPKDFATLDLAIDCAIANIEALRRILVVSFEEYSSDSPMVRFVEEPQRPDFPSMDDVLRRWRSENPSPAWRAGWIYQELLTLGAASYIGDLTQTYLCIDADTLFLRPVRFLYAGARFPYTHSAYHPGPGTDAYRRLTGENPQQRSFTAHHMLYETELLEELFVHVGRLHDKPWFEAYLDCIDSREFSPISEQDVYANWVLTHHPELARHRQLVWADIRFVPNERQRRRLARRYDFVSAHAYIRQSRIRRTPNALMAAAGRGLRRLPGGRRVVDASRGQGTS